jgi:hypothetical protein
MNDPNQPNLPAKGQFLVYQSEDGRIKIDVRLAGETAWLTQARMAELFQTTIPNVNMHLRNIFAEGELQANSVIQEFLITAADGKNYRTNHYNLDAIISVGYRVKSAVATRFRIWATQKLREYIVKGFVLDDERLKNPDQPFDYFDELLRRIQDIRTSERRFYQKITDLYATSIDYDPTQPESIEFFQTVQNKMHWAITGQTAAEIIHARADSAKPNMGLTNWRGAKAQGGRPHRQELPQRGRTGRVEQPRRAISRLCRRPGHAPRAHAHEGLDREAPRLPHHQRPQYPHSRRQNLAPDGQGIGRGGIREVQPPAHPASRRGGRRI